MKRRDFVQNATLMGGFIALSSPMDRLKTRDIETGPKPDGIVINGLDPSVISEDYVKMQRSAGVNCWIKTSGNVRDFSDTYNFIDSHDQVVMAVRTVEEIHQANEGCQYSLI